MIASIIPPRGYERIRDRICQILTAEFANQYQLTVDVGEADADIENVQVFMERFVPFDHSELPAVNVGIERGDYTAFHQGQHDGTYRFFIECNTKAPTDDQDGGDTVAKILVQKIMGLAQAIITDPIYKTLSFPLGELVGHLHVEMFVFGVPTQQDGENCTMSRMSLVVKAVETNRLKDGVALTEAFTSVKLNEGAKGFYWTYSNS
jgi:hypothetical protein